MWLRVALLVSVALAVAPAAQQPARIAPRSVAGVVRDAVTRAPIAGARVRAGGGLPNAVTWCFLWDRQDRLLVGTDLGLARSTATGWETVAGTADHQVRSVVGEADGTLWMGGGPADVLRVGANGDVRKYAVPAS